VTQPSEEQLAASIERSVAAAREAQGSADADETESTPTTD
jgi:hypothetical protein